MRGRERGLASPAPARTPRTHFPPRARPILRAIVRSNILERAGCAMGQLLATGRPAHVSPTFLNSAAAHSLPPPLPFPPNSHTQQADEPNDGPPGPTIDDYEVVNDEELQAQDEYIARAGENRDEAADDEDDEAPPDDEDEGEDLLGDGFLK